MATLREYYEKDFSHNVRLHVEFTINRNIIEGALLYDFAGYFAFLACYIPDKNKDLNFFIEFLSSLKYGNSYVNFQNKVTLPAAKEFPGKIKIKNTQNFEILAQYFGDDEWMSTKNIQASKRIFIYSETELTDDDIIVLKTKAKELGHIIQFRSERFRIERSKHEKPLAFICHDSRDKDDVARKLAVNLQKMLCPVWYDDFSLKVGDNLRDSIEKGLKECKKCILVLSPNFISNNGWTKTEFDSIFTRQLLEKKSLVLPIWYKVNEQDVYNYSPSLLNIEGVDWEKDGEENVCRHLYKAIIN